MATSATYYIDASDFTTATAVWTDAALTIKAPDGYYSFGGNYRYQFEGLLLSVEACAVAPTAYKISSFIGDPITQQVQCEGATYIDYVETITIRLTESDGTTPKVNTTGSNIIINFLVDFSGCFGDNNTYSREIIISPGQSETYIYNTGVTNNCGGVECVVVTDTYSCYTSISPSGITPNEGFYPLCNL